MQQELEPLTKTLKPIYADFVFLAQPPALAFAKSVVEHEWTVNVADAPNQGQWQVSVRRTIHPVFQEITVWLATLTARAAIAGGELDGWGHK
jgi:hypothetical protein